MKISAYKNLHYKCFSLTDGKHVVSHAHDVWFKDAEFVVQPAGRDKVRRTGQKNVHAFVRGTLGAPSLDARENMKRAYYNPKVYDHFVDVETLKPLKSASYVHLTCDGIFYQV